MHWPCGWCHWQVMSLRDSREMERRCPRDLRCLRESAGPLQSLLRELQSLRRKVSLTRLPTLARFSSNSLCKKTLSPETCLSPQRRLSSAEEPMTLSGLSRQAL